MADIIIALPRLEEAKNLKRLLVRNGYDVNVVCDSGAQVVSAVNHLDGGIVICGHRFSDMYYSEINEYLPNGFQMLLLASAQRLADSDLRGVVSLAMPFQVHELLSTLEMMLVENYRRRKRLRRKPAERTETDRKLIESAKELLMERNQLTEEEAHRYIQKLSMDSATKMEETAAMILELSGKEWEL